MRISTSTPFSAVACLVGLMAASPAMAQESSRAALDRFDRIEQAEWDAARDVPVFLSGELRAASSAPAESIARSFLSENDALIGLAGTDAVDFVSAGVTEDDLGMRHARVVQHVSGIPVFGAESVVHIDRTGAVYAFGGDVHPNAAQAVAQPALGAESALEAARAQLPAGAVLTVDAMRAPLDGPSVDADALAPSSELVIYPLADGTYRLAYHVDLPVAAPDPARWQVFVDARTGEVFHRFNAIHTAAGHGSAEGIGFDAHEAEGEGAAGFPAFMDGPSSGSGTSTFGGTRSLSTYLYQGSYYLYDTGRTNGYVRTMTAGNGTSLPGSYVTDSDNSFTASSQRAAVDAHYGAAATYDYFKNTHGRDSYNGSGASITSTVNYQSNYNNAFWNGTQMVYGDGDGQTFKPLVELDICAHELTHAVTSSTAKLIYQGASGALNEAVSDIFAVMVDRNDWTVGELSYTPGQSGDALRSLSNPPAGNQPDNYADRYTGSGDNGGVHINSGIFNKAAYLMAAGGTFRGVSVASMGRAKTERVWYRALTSYFSQSTGYSGARAGVLQATADLYGSNGSEYATVANAFAAVGIGSASSGGGGGSGGGGTPQWYYEDLVVQSPHNYPNNWNNTYTYGKNGAQKVAVYFQQFELETNYDYVYIRDGSGSAKATYTGTKNAFWAVVDGDEVRVNTVTDGSVTDYGWRITKAAYYSAGQLSITGGAGELLGFAPQAPGSDAVVAGSKETGLAQLAPNPARGQAVVTYALAEAMDVQVAAYDVLGRRVAVLASGNVGAGTHRATLDAHALPAGIYFVRMQAGGQTFVERLTITR